MCAFSVHSVSYLLLVNKRSCYYILRYVKVWGHPYIVLHSHARKTIEEIKSFTEAWPMADRVL